MVEQISGNRAKQGRSGTRVLLVLAIGLALAAIAWFALEFYGETIDSRSDAQPGAIESPNAAQ
jgi:hypothetical protein